MKLDLPDEDNLFVATDTETSGLFVDDGARLSIVSCAWRDSQTGDIQSRAFPFDQGPTTWLGDKPLPYKYGLRGVTLFDRWDNLEEDEWFQLTDWLQRQNLVYHHASFDMHMFRAGLRNAPHTGVNLRDNYYWDTMTVAPGIWPNQSLALKNIAERLWGDGEKDLQSSLKKWVTNNTSPEVRYDLAPMELILPYAADDTVKTLKLFEVECEAIDNGEIDRQEADRQIDEALVLYCMEAAGIGFDVPKGREAERTLLRRERELQTVVDRMTKKPGSTANDVARHWEQLGIPFPRLTDTGKHSMAQDVIREFVKDGVTGAAEYQELSLIQTALSGWYSNWTHKAGDDGRLRCKFHQTKVPGDMRDGGGKQKGTISARLAVERVNLLAIPHDYMLPKIVPSVRSLFVAKPGHQLWEIDLSQAEYRTAASLAGCTSMIERFVAGEDAHTSTCKMVFKIDTDHPKWDKMRKLAKVLNFSLLYGAGVESTVTLIFQQTGQVVSEAQVREWVTLLKKGTAEITRMGNELNRFAQRNRYIELVGGKRRYFRPGEFTHKALNAKIQGSVAVAMVDAMIDIHKQFGPDLMLLQIHDSVVIEPRIDVATQTVAEVQSIIVNRFESTFSGVPYLCDSKAWTH